MKKTTVSRSQRRKVHKYTTDNEEGLSVAERDSADEPGIHKNHNRAKENLKKKAKKKT